MWGKQQEDVTKHTQFNKDTAEFEAEQSIINDKEEFGRVRTSLMKYLEIKYGSDVARRSLRRVNARMSRGYFKKSGNQSKGRVFAHLDSLISLKRSETML